MRPRLQSTNLLLAATLTLGAAQAQALTELSDDSLSDVQGAGISLALEDFRYLMAPTSYIELTGSDPGAGTTLQRGDARYYGLSISSGEGSGIQQWSGSDSCTTSLMGCPIGGTIDHMASANNPYVLRVYDYAFNDWPGYDPQNPDSSRPKVYNAAGVESPTTVLELIGPSQTDLWRWAFWGEIEVGRDVSDALAGDPIVASNDGFLQSLTYIKGRPIAHYGAPAALGYDSSLNPTAPAQLQILQETSEQTFGIIYHSYLSGDFRFSAGVDNGSAEGAARYTGTLGKVPTFNDDEGLYFGRVNAYLPLGQLAYQSITFDDAPDKSGDFIIELTKIPGDPDDPAAGKNVYTDFYSLADGDTEGYQRTGRPERYYKTHGYVQWGVWFPDAEGIQSDGGGSYVNSTDVNGDLQKYYAPTATSTDQGIFFQDGAGAVTNIGTARMEGVLIQHMKITTCGAAPANCN